MSESMFGEVRTDVSWKRRSLDENELQGKRVAVVGGTGGIGQAMAQAMLAKGADVTIIGRTFRDKKHPRLKFLHADLSNLAAARKLAKELEPETLDILLMTQGIFAGKKRQTNAEGIELDMAVSHLSRSVMLHEMAQSLGVGRKDQTVKARVFIWGLPGPKKSATVDDFNSNNYVWHVAHANTVVANEALVLDAAQSYPNLNIYGMNPGIISSEIMSGYLGNGLLLKLQQTIMGVIFQSADQYAAKHLPLLVSDDLEDHSGAMFGRYADFIKGNSMLADPIYLAKVTAESEALIKRGLARSS